MNKIIVYGANGFIGKNLIDELAQNQEDKIIAFDRFSSEDSHTDNYFSKYNNVDIWPGDFLNISDLEKSLDGIDYVFHLVSTTTPASALMDPFIDIDTNVRASVQLFDLCVKKSIKKVIFLSSGGTVYGDIDSDKISEESVTRPKSPYGIGKLTIESYLRYYNSTYGLDYIVYRIANPYGPHQNIYARQGVIPIFIQHILDSLPLTVFGDGEMLRDYIYVKDVAKMINTSYSVKNHFNEYNIGSGIGRSINDLINLLTNLTNSKPTIINKDKPASYVETSVLDNSRFLKEFGNFDLTSLEDGIERTLDYVKKSKQ